MSSAFDAVGPSASGTSATSASSLNWTHTVGSITNTAILVGVSVGNQPDTGFTVSCKCAGITMNQVGISHADNQNAGYIILFGLAGVATGSNAIAVSVSTGTVGLLIGGSLSFSGVDQTTPFGTTYLAATGSAAPSIAVTGNTSGNVIAAFCGGAEGLTSTAGTSRILNNADPSNATGDGCANLGVSTIAAAGSTATISWSMNNDWWAAIGVEVLGTFTGIHPIGYPVYTNVAAASVTGTWGAAQARTSGNLLVAAVSAASATAGIGATATTSGWSQAAGHGIEEPNTASASTRAAIWTKTAAGADAAPVFTSASATDMDCVLFELNGANTTTPIDTSGVYASGSSTATLAAATFIATTAGNVTAAGEYAVSVFAQERAATASNLLFWTDSGSGNFGQLQISANSTTQVLGTYVGAKFPPASGATLSDKGQFLTDTSAFGSAIVAVFGVSAGITNGTAYSIWYRYSCR